MKQFKDFGIKHVSQSLVGEKIKIDKILNREITVYDYRLEASKFEKGTGKCLYLQIGFGEEKRVVFTGSKALIEAIEQVPKSEFPFTTTIIKENDRFEFS